jgi:response regulator of citrate/malate metabolism
VRRWKSIEDPTLKIWTYFREHPDKFFNEDHVAAQVGIGRRRTRRFVAELVGQGKLEAVETVSSPRGGRPKMMFRSVRGTAWDCLNQAELIA